MDQNTGPLKMDTKHIYFDQVFVYENNFASLHGRQHEIDPEKKNRKINLVSVAIV